MSHLITSREMRCPKSCCLRCCCGGCIGFVAYLVFAASLFPFLFLVHLSSAESGSTADSVVDSAFPSVVYYLSHFVVFKTLIPSIVFCSILASCCCAPKKKRSLRRNDDDD